ncbi:unnamed protein product [Urochloa humidicola]
MRLKVEGTDTKDSNSIRAAISHPNGRSKNESSCGAASIYQPDEQHGGHHSHDTIIPESDLIQSLVVIRKGRKSENDA